MVPPQNFNLQQRLVATAGFTLVEITLALGIITLCLTVLVGLLPIGLQTIKESRDDMARAQIARQITNQALLMSFDKLDTYTGVPHFFDGQGLETANEANSDTRYRVTMVRIDGAKFPGSQTAVKLSAQIATLKLQIKNIYGAQPPASSVIYISNQGG